MGLVTCVSHLPPLGKSDHCGTLIQLCVSAKQSQINESVLVHDWAKADFPEMRNEILWSDCINKLDIMNADEINTCLSDFLQQLVEKHVPKRILKNGIRLRWETKIGRKLINKKAAAFHRYRMSKSTNDYHIYAKLRNKVTAQLRSDRKNYESKLAND